MLPARRLWSASPRRTLRTHSKLGRPLRMGHWRSRASSPRCWIGGCARSRFSIRFYPRTARTKIDESAAGKFGALLIPDDLRYHVALRMMLDQNDSAVRRDVRIVPHAGDVRP